MLVAGAGIEPTPERSERPVLPLDDPASFTKVRGAGLEPASPGSKPGSLPLADPRECAAGIEPALPAWKAGTSAARPRAQSCGGRNRTCVGAVNSRLPVPARVPPQNQSARLESNQHLRAPEARGLSVSPTRRRMSAQRELNPLFRPGKAAGCRYIMGACRSQPNCQIARAPGRTRTGVSALRVRSLGR